MNSFTCFTLALICSGVKTIANALIIQDSIILTDAVLWNVAIYCFIHWAQQEAEATQQLSHMLEGCKTTFQPNPHIQIYRTISLIIKETVMQCARLLIVGLWTKFHVVVDIHTILKLQVWISVYWREMLHFIILKKEIKLAIGQFVSNRKKIKTFHIWN